MNDQHFDRPLKIGPGVYWVGSYRQENCRLSSSFIIQDGKEAVLLDGGSREDFASLVLKVLQLGIQPSNITALVYQNQSPRLWESRHHLQTLINRKDLKIVSDLTALQFMSSGVESGRFRTIEDMGFVLEFASGRRLEFKKTPFAPGAGSFVTFDEESGVLFTGKLFSSHGVQQLFLGELDPQCWGCLRTGGVCDRVKGFCPVHSMEQYHQDIMPSERALKYALEQIATTPFTILAPQQGGIVTHGENILFLWQRLCQLKGVGIDGILGDRSYWELGNVEPLKRRFRPPAGAAEGACPDPKSCFAEWEA